MSESSVVCADVLDWAKEYNGPKFHALLCDPPYELGFMGKDWDRSGVAFQSETWAALAEHLHPGAFGMAFASARGWHRLAVAIEDAGLRIHPSIFGWSYGSGFPKATRIDTQVDKAAGAEREVAPSYVAPDGKGRWGGRLDSEDYQTGDYGTYNGAKPTLPATPLAQSWAGHRYGLQALKPALEPIIVFQKPYQGKPVECITATGAGALWIDGGRIGKQEGDRTEYGVNGIQRKTGTVWGKQYGTIQFDGTQGRWPANFVLVHHPECRRVGERRVRGSHSMGQCEGKHYSDDGGMFGANTHAGHHHVDPDGLETIAAWDCHESCPARRLGEQSGERASSGIFNRDLTAANNWTPNSGGCSDKMYSDTGTAARFFFQAAYNLEHADPVMYCAKASRKERDAGLDVAFPLREPPASKRSNPAPGRKNALGEPRRNGHPTVKPLALAQWLATLLLPPEEYAPRRMVIPFCGTLSEGIGALLAGWDEIVAIDSDRESCDIGEARLAHWMKEPSQPSLVGLA